MNDLIEQCTKNYCNDDLLPEFHQKKNATLETHAKTKVQIEKK